MNEDLSAPEGRLPDFMVIGAQKSGTTSIAAALGRTSGVYVTPKKELHYFQRFDPISDPESWSRYLDEFGHAPVGSVVGEATPNYLSSRVAPARIHAQAPDIRLIASLRNPVDRAYSSFWHARRFGIVPRSMGFAEFIERDTRDFGSEWTGVVSDGCYSTQILRYLLHFRREQLCIVLFDDLIRNPDTTMRDITRHISPADVPDDGRPFPHKNSAHTRHLPRLSRRLLNPYGRAPRSFPWLRRLLIRRDEVIQPMDPAVRGMLTEIYRPWNRELETLLDRSLAEWGT